MNVERINNRFRELMLRDHLVLEYLNEFNEYMDSNPALNEGSHILDPPKAVRLLGARVFEKWNSPLIEGMNNVEYFMVQKILPPISELGAWKQEVTFPDFPEHPRQVSAFFENEGHVYIDINCSVLDKNDAKYVKSAVWELVKARLEARQDSTKSQGQKMRKPASPSNDPPELAPFYHMGEDVFRNYLRWYDIHTKERLGFRLIAFLEPVRKENALAYEQWLAKLRIAKWKVGNDRGLKEDRVEKGVKLIWLAIHREPYTPKKVEPVMEEWNCPAHGNNFSVDCKHCKSLQDRFNRIYNMDKDYMPTLSDLSIPGDVIDALPYVSTGRIARKPKSRNKNDVEG